MAGRGVAGAIAMIRGGVEGLVPGTLDLDGRCVPATATELALAVRSALIR